MFLVRAGVVTQSHPRLPPFRKCTVSWGHRGSKVQSKKIEFGDGEAVLVAKVIRVGPPSASASWASWARMDATGMGSRLAGRRTELPDGSEWL